MLLMGPSASTNNDTEASGFINALRIILKRDVVPPGARFGILFLTKHPAKIALDVTHATRNTGHQTKLHYTFWLTMNEYFFTLHVSVSVELHWPSKHQRSHCSSRFFLREIVSFAGLGI